MVTERKEHVKGSPNFKQHLQYPSAIKNDKKKATFFSSTN